MQTNSTDLELHIKNVSDAIMQLRMATIELSLYRGDALYHSETTGPVGDAARALILAQEKYTKLVKEQYAKIKKEKLDIIYPFLTKIFKTPIPGLVTLPIKGEHTSKRVVIENATMVVIDTTGNIHGIVDVASEDGRSHTTENFSIVNGEPYFLTEDLY